MKKSEYITFRTDATTKAFLESLAEEEERTLSWIINKILTSYITKHSPEEEEIND